MRKRIATVREEGNSYLIQYNAEMSKYYLVDKADVQFRQLKPGDWLWTIQTGEIKKYGNIDCHVVEVEQPRKTLLHIITQITKADRKEVDRLWYELQSYDAILNELIKQQNK